MNPLRTLDPADPLDDLEWLDDAIGDARVVAIGESAHYTAESYRLRHRRLRYLAERHGFGAYAMESGFVEGWLVDNWVRGGEDPLGQVMADGITSLMGLWTQMRAQLEWMRQHNRTAGLPIGFYGIDLSGSNASLLPGLDAVIAYLAQVDPDFHIAPSVRETASAFAAKSAFSIPAAFTAYKNLALESRDTLTANLADLTSRLTSRRLDYIGPADAHAHERTLHALNLTVTVDAMFRELARDNRRDLMLNCEAGIAATVEWILRREDRIVLAAHNAHVQRWPATLPGTLPVTPMGMHLADRLGGDYVVIGMTSSDGRTLNTGADFFTGTLFTDLEPPQPGSLDALMAASHNGPFAIDLRRLSAADSATVQAVTRQRYGSIYSDVNPLNAYDALLHLPHVSAAEPDTAALAHAPREVQDAFAPRSPR